MDSRKKVSLDEVLYFFHQELDSDSFQDHSMNGLQVEGKQDITKIAASVDCGLGVIEEAARLKADALLVHHGFFWGQPLAIVGAHRKALKLLIEHEISLIAQHLPLDASAKHGNNHLLARILELSELRPSALLGNKHIGISGLNQTKRNISEICSLLEKSLIGLEKCHALSFGPDIPERICVVSGSAADHLYRYKEEGFDTFITGEPKQFAYHFCRDNGVNAIFAGHYATETLGVDALAKAASNAFNLDYSFIHLPTGI